MEVANFLPEQYEADAKCEVTHNYLQQQFADHDEILAKIKTVVQSGDFTLGRTVDEFEEEFRAVTNAKHAVGLGSGTDAIFLSLKALGVGPGDEVITTPFTFYATIGAIVTAGATPVFADVLPDYNIDPAQIAKKITKKTKAIVPVHWAGKPCHMDAIMEIAMTNGLHVVEDACHAIQATYKGRKAGSFGDFGCFSFHPLKNLNVWGDGGIAVTNSDEFATELRLLRNHGLKGRDECERFAYNSRLDTVQAVVASHLLQKLDNITETRIANANCLDSKLSGISEVTIPQREDYIKQVYHLYSVLCENRDELQQFLISKGVDAKVHYPIPMHLQPAASKYGHKAGDFPMAEHISNNTLSLPVHEFVTREDCDRMASAISEFYQ